MKCKQIDRNQNEGTGSAIPRHRGHTLEVVNVVGSEDQEQSDGGYGYFAYGSYDEGAGALFEEVFQVGTEAYSGEGQ